MGHFYDVNAQPCHEMVGANGKVRPTTLRDAKKLKLYKSVTTVLDVQAKPALIQWLQNELINAAIANPYHPHEWDETKWKTHVLTSMRSKSKKAAERGTEIHNKMDVYYKTNQLCSKDRAFLTPAIELINKTFPNRKWKAEVTFVEKGLGYGGSVDLHCEDIIIDFKTKDKTDIKDMVQYDDHKMQLAAYAKGLGLSSNVRLFNLFISTSTETPGLCKLVECTDYQKHLEMFLLLNSFWDLKNNINLCRGNNE